MADVVKIRVPQDVVTLEVNDNGDTVVLPVSDERFNKKLIDFAKKVQEESDKINTSEESDILEVVNTDVEFHEMLKDEFNKLFGDRAYEKTFGEDVLVGAEYIIEFIDQCLPYLKDYQNKRIEKFNKYNANRVGSSL